MKNRIIYFITAVFFLIVMTALATYFYNYQNASAQSGPILNLICKSTVANAKKPLERQISKLQDDLKNLQNQITGADEYVKSLVPSNCVTYANDKSTTPGFSGANMWSAASNAWNIADTGTQADIIKALRVGLGNVSTYVDDVDDTRNGLNAALYGTLAWKYNKIKKNP